MKKKLAFWALSAVLVFGLAGCGSEGTKEDDTVVSVGSGVEFVEATAEPTEEPTPEPTEAPTPEPTEAPTPEPTETPTPEVEQSDDNTNPAFYNWVSKDNEDADIAWFTENFGATEAELRTWDEEQWDYAMYVWMYGEAPSNKKTIGYDVCVDGLGFAEEYYIEAETVYDVLIAAEFYKYHEIKELYVNGVLIEDDPRNVPINDGDEISIEAYDIH